MKNHKFLTIFIVLLILLNITYFSLKKFTNYEGWINEKVEDLLEDKLNSEVEIGKTILNEKVINFDSIKIDNPDFSLRVEAVMVKYNLFKAVFQGLKFEQISIVSPRFIYKYEIGSNSPDRAETFELNKIASLIEKYHKPVKSFAKDIKIFDGFVKIDITNNSIQIKKTIKNINAEFTAAGKKNLQISGDIDENGRINLFSIFKRNKFKKLSLSFLKVNSDGITNSFFKKNQTTLSGDIVLHKNNLEYKLNLDNGDLKFYRFDLNFDKLAISGNRDTLSYNFSKAVFNNAPVYGGGKISNLFTGNEIHHANFKTNKLTNKIYYRRLKGYSNIEAKVSGYLNDPKVDFEIFSPELDIMGEKLKNTEIIGKLDLEDINFTIKKASYHGNEFSGKGKMSSYENVYIDFISKNHREKLGLFDLKIDAEGKFVSDFDNVKVHADITNGEIAYNDITLKKLHGQAYLNNSSLNLKIKNKDITAKVKYNIWDSISDGLIKINSLKINSIYSSQNKLPTVAGNLSFKNTENNLELDSKLRVYDERYGLLDGFIETNFIADYIHNRTYLSLHTTDGIYNFTPFNISLIAGGNLDRIDSYHCKINNDLKADFSIDLSSSLKYSFSLKGKDVEISRYFEYFEEYIPYDKIEGNADIDFQLQHSSKDLIRGDIRFKKFAYNEMQDLDIKLAFKGTTENINIPTFKLIKDKNIFFKGRGNWNRQEDSFSFESIADSLRLDYFFQDHYSGIINGDLTLKRTKENFTGFGRIYGEDLIVNKRKIDNLNLKFTQNSNSFIVNKFNLDSQNSFKASAFGRIGYNFITGNSYNNPNSIDFVFDGDLLSLFVNSESHFIEKSQSNAKVNLSLKSTDDGLNIQAGKIFVESGKFKIKNQPFEFSNIEVDANIKNNKLLIRKFKSKAGNGELIIKNEIKNDGKDLILGNFNFGHFYLKTNKDDLTVNVPLYTPENSYLNVNLKGRYDKFAELHGPLNDLVFQGDLLVSNGNAIFPAGVDNVMRLLTQGMKNDNEEIKTLDDADKIYPISLDFKVIFKQNNNYVTYPVNLRIKDGSYLWIVYNKGDWDFKEANFTSEEGTLEMFDNTFQTDKFEVLINQYEEQPFIAGTFYKILPDGSQVTLDIYRKKNQIGNLIGDLKFDLTSDNPNSQTLTEILANLKYNKNYDELTTWEKNELVQDEALQIAGVGLNSTVVSPILTPLENWIRRFFNLDTFSFKIVFIGNLIEKYAGDLLFNSEERAYANTSLFSTNLLLNNLSVSAGKNIFNRFYLQYDAAFEESNSLDETELDLNQFLQLRYRLPYGIKASYKYKIYPDSKNSHEIFFNKTLHF